MNLRQTFVGAIGVEGGYYLFATLGDPVKCSQRLVAAAKGGEIIMSEVPWNGVSSDVPAESATWNAKGSTELLTPKAYGARITSA